MTNTPEKGAAGNEPEKARAGESAAETGADGAAPRPTSRRRGSRGGRRHKKPSERSGSARGAPAMTAVGELPTAPLIPVGAADSEPVALAAPKESAAGSGETAASTTPATPATTKRRRRSRPKAHVAETGGQTDAAGTPPPPRSDAERPTTEQKAEQKAEATATPKSPVSDTDGSDAVATEGTPRKRRRGSRGGRRRRREADVVQEEVKREAEEAAGEPAHGDEAADVVEPGTVTPVEAPREAPAPDGEGEQIVEADAREGTAKSRRRGGRGGRKTRATRDDGETTASKGEAAADATAGASDGASDGATGKKTKAAAGGDNKSRRRDHRRPKAIVRQDEGRGLGTSTPLELGKKRSTVVAEKPDRRIILVTDDGEELRVALVEDARLAEIYIERPDKKSYLGDIYQGKVENVMNGIDAAFVDFGLEKNGFLYVDDVTTPEGEKRARRIGDALKNGQQVLVQVTKDPMGHKGARLSTKISLAGRYLVYVPGGSGVGISRRLRPGERDRLRDISKELKPKNAGLIVRTIAEGHGLEDLRRDMRYLSRLWSRLKKKAETVKAPGLVHKEVDISVEVARDLFNDTCESLIIDDAKRHKTIVSFLEKEAPELLPKVHLHSGDEPLFEAYGIEEQIAKALERRVPLKSGGNLVIDHAEALTVIDVNTGRFTRGKGLEDTITKTNLEAAREVVRQLRLRDIGGIIIIDFIDMAHAKNREMVLDTLEAELESDRTKTYVVELSPLGLVEMTRQNTTDGARGILTRTCPVCSGKARVLSEETMALSVERKLRTLARKSQAQAWLLEINSGVAERLSGPRLKRLEKQIGRRVFLEGASGVPVDAYRVIAEGAVAHVQEQRVPVREGQEVTVELEFSLTYSPRDAVGYVDGYMVIVEGGRQHLGKRRRVRITETVRSGGRAVLSKQAAN